MVDEISKVTQQTFSRNGMKLTDIKKDNELLFNYFKNAGYKEDAVIYSSDIEKLQEQFDTNGNDKLSQRELKKMLGDNVSRKERRAFRQSLETIRHNDLSNNDELLPEQVNEFSTNYRNNKGELIYTETNSETEGNKKTYYLNGNQNKIDKTVTTSQTDSGNITTTTTYVDGDSQKIKEQVTDDAGDVTKTKYNWDGYSLLTTETTHNNDVTFTRYRNVQGENVEETVLEQFKSDPESFAVTKNQFNEDGGVIGQTTEFNKAKIDNNTRVIKQTLSFKEPIMAGTTPLDSNIQSSQVTILNQDNKEEILNSENIGGKFHRVEKDKDGNSFVTVKIPEGWSVEKLAEEYGVSKEDLLKANLSADGRPVYHTNSKGQQYFLIDQGVHIKNPTKISDEIGEERYLYGEEAEKCISVKSQSNDAAKPSKSAPAVKNIKPAKVEIALLRRPEVPKNIPLEETQSGNYTATEVKKDKTITYTLNGQKKVTQVKIEHQRANKPKRTTVYQYDSQGHTKTRKTYENKRLIATAHDTWAPFGSNGKLLLAKTDITRSNGDVECREYNTSYQNRTGGLRLKTVKVHNSKTDYSKETEYSTRGIKFQEHETTYGKNNQMTETHIIYDRDTGNESEVRTVVHPPRVKKKFVTWNFVAGTMKVRHQGAEPWDSLSQEQKNRYMALMKSNPDKYKLETRTAPEGKTVEYVGTFDSDGNIIDQRTTIYNTG